MLRSSLLFLLAAVAGLAAADEVYLRDGSELKGEIVDDGDPLKIAIGVGDKRVVVEVPRAQVLSVWRLDATDQRALIHAEEALLTGDLPEALKTLRALVERRPDDPRALKELGFALVLANADEEAAQVLGKVAEQTPRDFEVHLQLAQVCERRGQRDAAIEAFAKVFKLNPVHPIGARSLARLLVERHGPGDVERALEVLAYAGKLSPADEALALELAELRLRRDPEASAARAGLEAFCAANPQAWQAARRLAALLIQLGEPGQADALLASRVKAAPEPVRELLATEAAWYGWLAGGREALAPRGLDVADLAVDPERAARGLDLLLTRAPQDARLVLARARVELRAGREDAGRELLERVALSGDGRVMRDALLLQQALGALENDPPSPTLFGPQVSLPNARRVAALLGWRVEAQRALAQALERAGEFSAAAEAYSAARARTQVPAQREQLKAAEERARDEAKRVDRNRGM
ncbi:MAG: tetratricopeptide repeat protein [Planctomycetes bacterium]|nr:tetratricopeptide repeat protein [Planctomycetota bacterium]